MHYEQAVEKSENVFGDIQLWCKLNKIQVNKKKRKHMIVGAKKNKDERIGIDDISLVENFMYLGVTIDNRLNFEKFINNTISRVNGRLITMARIRKLVDMKTALLIYKQTVLPIIDYVCVLVNSSTQRKIGKLQPLQNRAIRTILKCTGYISTEEMENLHETQHLKLLSTRRKLFMLKMMYKISLIDENVDMYRPEMQLRTGPKVKMKIAFTEKERVRKSPYYLCNQLWDKLNSKTQTSCTMIEFLNNLKEFNIQML